MKGLLAAGIATALAIIVLGYRLSNPVPAGEKARTLKLVLAAHDLEPGTIIRAGDVALTDWPGEVPIPAAYYHTQHVIGRVVITKTYAKEPILENRLAPKGAGAAPAVRNSQPR